MSLLTNLFLGTALIAGTACLLVFLGWLWVQVEGNFHHIYRRNRREDHRD